MYTLRRFKYGPEGVFGYLYDGSGSQIAVTCEHAYEQPDGSWAPKIPPGTYDCLFGSHDLGVGPFETYEVTGVAGHTGLLFHKGNTEGDSHGCILLGKSFGDLSGSDAVLQSAVAFQDFLNATHFVPTFELEVQ